MEINYLNQNIPQCDTSINKLNEFEWDNLSAKILTERLKECMSQFIKKSGK